MTFSRSTAAGRLGKGRGPRVAALLFAVFLASACGGAATLGAPRPLVVSSGARLVAEPERMQEVYDWVMPQIESIEGDETIRIVAVPSEQDTYPWETLVVQGDTARFQHSRTNPDIETPYRLYAHFHLMSRLGRLEHWLPEAHDAEGYELERAIVKRVADSWLLGRAIFDTQPHGLMDELIYATEGDYLDAFLFTARPDAFPEEREAWIEENPGGLQAYQEWFRSTFNGEPPGLRTGARTLVGAIRLSL